MTATVIPVARPASTTQVQATTVETRTTGCRRVTESTSSLGAWYCSMLARWADLPSSPQGIHPHLRNGSYLSVAIVTPLFVGLSRGDAAGPILHWSGRGRRKDRPPSNEWKMVPRFLRGSRQGGWSGLRPEARLGLALRRARESRGISLRALARTLHRSHSTLVEYERGHRLAPLDVVEAYESELGLGAGTLAAVHERARLELYGADRSRRQTYVLKPVLNMPHQLPSDVANF